VATAGMAVLRYRLASLPQTGQHALPTVKSCHQRIPMKGLRMRADQILPDDVDHGQFQGVTIRKGTVAAFLANARAWTDARASADVRAQASREIARDLPALRALGLFEVLQIRDERLRALVDAA